MASSLTEIFEIFADSDSDEDFHGFEEADCDAADANDDDSLDVEDMMYPICFNPSQQFTNMSDPRNCMVSI